MTCATADLCDAHPGVQVLAPLYRDFGAQRGVAGLVLGHGKLRARLREPRLRGLVVEGEGRRYYPRRELAGPLLGFVAPDGEGKDGLEFSMNEDLKGRVDKLSGLRDRSGRLLFSDGIEDEQALAGHNVYLTIDQGIQYTAERELMQSAREFEAAGGSVVVVDPNSGEILALASWPFFNPNDYGDAEPSERKERGASQSYEPGSSVKMFTVAAGLAAGVITPTQKLYCEKGVMPVDNVVIRDTHPAEWLTISQILAVSSNICAAKIGLGLGEEKLYEAFRRFGFGEKPGIDVPGEASGTLARKDRAHARPRHGRAVRGVLPLRGRVPGGLHFAASHRRRARAPLPGVFPYQLLALHLLRLLRRSVPHVCHPAHSRF